MSRNTLDRQWSDAEFALAGEIVHAVAKGEGRLVGTLSICRELGLPATHKSRRRVWAVMPLAALLCPGLKEGQALVIGNDRTYWVTTDPMLVRRDAVRRVKPVHTKLRRILATLGPISNTAELPDIVFVRAVRQALEALDPALLDAVVMGSVEEAGA